MASIGLVIDPVTLYPKGRLISATCQESARKLNGPCKIEGMKGKSVNGEKLYRRPANEYFNPWKESIVNKTQVTLAAAVVLFALCIGAALAKPLAYTGVCIAGGDFYHPVPGQ